MAVDARKAVQGAGQGKRAIKGVGDQATKSSKQVKTFDNRLDEVKKSGFGLKTAMTGLFAGIGAAMAIRDVTRVTMGFEQTMSTLRAVTGATAEDMAALEERARALGATTRFSAQEAGESLVFLARAGFTAQDAITALPDTLDLAAAGMIDLGEAGDIASNVLSQFGLRASEMTRVSDVMVNTANSANTNIQMLAETMKFAGPVAGALGVSLEELAAGAGALGDSGIQASLAGTSLRGVMARLLRPSGEASTEIRKMGLSMKDLNPATNKLVDIFQRFRDANMSASQALRIFGRLQVAGALVLTQNVDKWKKLTAANQEATGAAKEAARIMADNLAGSFKALRSSLEEAYLQMGEEGFTGGLRGLVEVATDTIRVMADIENEAGTSARVLAAGFEGMTVAAASYIALKLPVALGMATVGMYKQAAAATILASKINPFTNSTILLTTATTGSAIATNMFSMAMVKLRAVLMAHPVLALAAVFGGIYAAVKGVNYLIDGHREKIERLRHQYDVLKDRTEEWQDSLNRLKLARYMEDQSKQAIELRRQYDMVYDTLAKIRGELSAVTDLQKVSKIVPHVDQEALETEMQNMVDLMDDWAKNYPKWYQQYLAQYFKVYDAEIHKWAKDLPRLEVPTQVFVSMPGGGAAHRTVMKEYVQVWADAANASGMLQNKLRDLRKELESLGQSTEDPKNKLDEFAMFMRKRETEAGEAAQSIQKYIAGLVHERNVLKASSEEEKIRIELSAKYRDELDAMTPIMRRFYLESLVNTAKNNKALKESIKSEKDYAAAQRDRAREQSDAKRELFEYLEGMADQVRVLEEGKVSWNGYQAGAEAASLALEAGIKNADHFRQVATELQKRIDELTNSMGGITEQTLDDLRFEIDLLKMTNKERMTELSLRQLAQSLGIQQSQIDGDTAQQVRELNDALEFTIRMRQMAEGISGALGRGFEDIIFDAENAADIIQGTYEQMAREVLRSMAIQPMMDELTSGLTGMLSPDVTQEATGAITAAEIKTEAAAAAAAIDLSTADIAAGTKTFAAAMAATTEETAAFIMATTMKLGAIDTALILDKAAAFLFTSMVEGATIAAGLLAGGGAAAGGGAGTAGAKGLVFERAQHGTILNSPTIIPTASGRNVLAGEAGDEVVAPIVRSPKTGNVGVELVGGKGGNTYNLNMYFSGNQSRSDMRKSGRQFLDDVRMMTRGD
jgi:TP901 family phage tail tape measure protein